MRLSSPVVFLTFLLTFVFAVNAYSQDDIIMRNNDVVKAKVEEVGVNVIKYHKTANPDGPVYDVLRSEVYMIVYANGSRDVITPQSNTTTTTTTITNSSDGYSDDSPAPDDDVSTTVIIRTAPPEIPVYEQPYCPMEGYIWTPGYWAYGYEGYYWVPGVWVSPPRPGFLWTPGYWGFEAGYYGWHHGYWGEHIGFYGGVNYGYGYEGYGYCGGRWEGGVFRYNTVVSRVDVNVIHTTYIDHSVVHNTYQTSRASYNGEGGVRAQPTFNEQEAQRERHEMATPDQKSHVIAARSDKNQYATVNNGRPTVAAMNRPNGEYFNTEGHAAQPHLNTAVIRPVHPDEHHNNNGRIGDNTEHKGEPARQNQERIEEHNAQPAKPTQERTGEQHMNVPDRTTETRPQEHYEPAPANIQRTPAERPSNNQPAQQAPARQQNNNRPAQPQPQPQHSVNVPRPTAKPAPAPSRPVERKK